VNAPGTITAADLMRPALKLAADTPVYAALRTMRETRSHLVVVVDDGRVRGLITLADVLERLLPTADSAS
jgi:CBS domain containing-hemolysin-like protein